MLRVPRTAPLASAASQYKRAVVDRGRAGIGIDRAEPASVPPPDLVRLPEPEIAPPTVSVLALTVMLMLARCR